MKLFSPAWIALSLALNVALVGLLLVGRTKISPADATSEAAVAVAVAANPPAASSAWTQLDPQDLPALVAQLRERGFPPAMIRAITLAQLQETYLARRRALDPNPTTRPFWKNT